ncbi:MAG: hypothetical protein HZA94_00390 [Candidatus Vogelbacteria bacterium]|nr:hypothetical protein [Candidatus Vogelbacteria bacterium]
MKINTDEFKKKLETEKDKLEADLLGTSEDDPKRPENWEATYPERELGDASIEADPADTAENLEGYGERYDLNDVMEKRLNAVKDALKRIEDGTYGVCTVDGKPHDIEEERLLANPAATTCITHIEE